MRKTRKPRKLPRRLPAVESWAGQPIRWELVFNKLLFEPQPTPVSKRLERLYA